jgi:uncharacterized protein with PQ loop repeat
MSADIATAVLGLVGAVLSAAIALPQAVRAVRVGTAGVSPGTFQTTVGLGLVWTVYGLALELWLFALGNFILGASALVVLWAVRRDTGARWSLLQVVVLVGAVGGLVGVIEITWLGWYAALLSVLLRIPQMRLIRGAGSIDGVSVHTWVVSLAANLTWLLYGLIENDVRLIGGCSVNAVLSTSLILGVEARRRRERNLPDVEVAQA